MSTPDTHLLPVDQAGTDAAVALMDCYNPPPLPAAAPVANPWADEASRTTITQPLQACYGE